MEEILLNGSDGEQPQGNGYGQYGKPSPSALAYIPARRGVIPLRELSITETLDCVLRLLKFNPVAFIVFPLLISLVCTVVSEILLAVLGESSSLSVIEALGDPDSAAGILLSSAAGFFGVSFIISVIFGILELALTSIASTRVTLASVRGRKMGLRQTWQAVKPGCGKLILRIVALTAVLFFIMLFFLILVTACAALVIGGVFSVFGQSGISVALSVLAGIAVLAAEGILYLRLMTAACALVAEETTVFGAISRAWVLTRKSIRYLFAVMLLSTVLITIVAGVASAVGAISVAALVDGTDGLGIGGVIASSVMFLLISAIFVPYMTVLNNLIYVNMRFRRENFQQQLFSGD